MDAYEGASDRLMDVVDRELMGIAGKPGLVERIAAETGLQPRDVLAEIIAAATQMYRGSKS